MGGLSSDFVKKIINRQNPAFYHILPYTIKHKKHDNRIGTPTHIHITPDQTHNITPPQTTFNSTQHTNTRTHTPLQTSTGAQQPFIYTNAPLTHPFRPLPFLLTHKHQAHHQHWKA